MEKLKEKVTLFSTGKKNIIVKTRKGVFHGITFVLLPICLGLFLTVLLKEYFKDGKVYSIGKILLAVGVICLLPLILSLFLSRYRLFFDGERITYQNFLRKRMVNINEIDFARYEYGYEDISEKNIPFHRFVIYPKPNLEKSPIIINLSPLASIEKIVKQLEKLDKLKPEKDYTESP